ncbi:dihydroxyacetone kinase subunit DhaK [Aggregatilinea lenta]|uniref:dihydroxyacetone kinase subunit DhaK n=1 Tax=Aggregatilinea lenta TaxID=913108 RepID=UPI000E5A25A1|nr:dihydroxyacetone kinase subunit DhaK [Aggregatilinea lenta]
MRKAKKILNDPKNVVPEMLDGLVATYNGRVRKLDGVTAMARVDIPDGKVALLIGGGSGHEPAYHGYVGDNMADGAALGNVFAAPTPDIILEATKAIHRGKGVLYLYGNYAGDILNFDMAAELAADEGIEVQTLLIRDDVACGPIENRRGIGGAMLAVKIAGGAAATLDTLDGVVRVTSKALDNIRSVSVALHAGSIPETGQFTFDLPDDEIEIGMGVHGETGVWREKMVPTDVLVDKMLELILQDLPFERGDEVCVLVNGAGSTTNMELLIANRRVLQILDANGIAVHESVAGSLFTTQEMAGFSISLMRLDDELKRYYDMPIRSFGWTKW